MDGGRDVEFSVGDDQGISSHGCDSAERYAESHGSLRVDYRLRRREAQDFHEPEAGDVAILNADDEIVSSWARGLRAHVVSFSVKQQLEEGLFLRGRRDRVAHGDGEKALMMRDEMKLRGLHNVENVLAALAAGLACGAAPESMRETMQNFRAGRAPA